MVFGAAAGERVDYLGRRGGRGGKFRSVRDPACLPQHCLEVVATRDRQAMGAGDAFDPKAVRDTLRSNQCLPRAGVNLSLPDLEAHLAFEQMENFIFAMVNVQRGCLSPWHPMLDDADLVIACQG